MKIYLIIKESDSSELEEFKKQETYSILDKMNSAYSLYCIEGDYRQVVNTLIVKNVKGLFVHPWLSESLIEAIVGISDEEILKKIPHGKNQNKLLNNLLIDHIEDKPLSSMIETFYDYGFLINKEETDNQTIDENNRRLDFRGLRINMEDIRPSLLDFFVKSLKTTTKEDLLKLDREMNTSEERNEEFPYNVLANFILLASDYYTKEEIKEFLEKEVKNRE